MTQPPFETIEYSSSSDEQVPPAAGLVGGDSVWLLNVFHRLRLFTFVPLVVVSWWVATTGDWGRGTVVGLLALVLVLDAHREASRSAPRPPSGSLVLDTIAMTAILIAGQFPMLVVAAVFSVMISAGAVMLPWDKTIRYYALLGVCGLVAGGASTGGVSPWSPEQQSALSVGAIGVIPLLTVITLLVAGRGAGVSRVLGGRLSATEAALRATEQRFRRAFGSAPSGLVITDLEGNITQINDAFALMIGSPVSTLVGTNLFEYIDPTDNEVSEAEVDRLLAAGPRSHLHDRRLLRSDGQPLWTIMSVSLIEDETGEATSLVAHIMDVTERRQSRAALEASNQELQALHQISRAGLEAGDFSEASHNVAAVIRKVMDFPGVAICIHDPDRHTMRTVASLNPTGLERDEVDVERALCAWAALSRKPYTTVSADGGISDVDPSVRTVLSIPIQIDESTYGAVTLTDHREREVDEDMINRATILSDHVASFLRRVRAEDALSGLLRAKDQFIASVSHELRTPLTAVVGLAAELRDRHDSMDPDESSEIMEIIAQQSTDVANIVEDLLVAARSDLDQLSVKRVSFETRSQVLRVIRELHRYVGMPKIGAPDGEATAFGDRGRFRQIIRNLLTNALRYGGPDVAVEITHDAGGAKIEVSDDGEGVPVAEWGEIFEPYRRSRHAVKQPDSVGIGLTVSRKLAHLMGGDLTYRYVDGRSIFELTVPSEPPSTAPPNRVRGVSPK